VVAGVGYGNLVPAQTIGTALRVALDWLGLGEGKSQKKDDHSRPIQHFSKHEMVCRTGLAI
jgi:hypothetical protein